MIRQAALCAPSVGTWYPAVGLGAPLEAGGLLGRLQRAGAWLDVHAPEGSGGVAIAVADAGSWVEHGTELVVMGEGGAGLARPAPVVIDDDERGALPEGCAAVRADTDGTVYLLPEPGSPPFAPQGAHVVARDTLALVEVMKTFSAVRAPGAGTVERVWVRNGDSVTAGEVLFWIRGA